MATQPMKAKKLGLWMLTALVTGNMIGAGVFLLPASLANFGSISLLGWGLTSLGAICLALVFAKLGSSLPKVGGPYAYCHEAFGEFTGFQMAYNYWIALCIGNTAIALGFTSYLSIFVPAIATHKVLACSINIGLVWLVTVINLLGVRLAGFIQVITIILKLTPLILLATIGLWHFDPQHLKAFNLTHQSNFQALASAATLTLWSFIGIESASIPANDVVDPQRNIPRATIYGTVLAAMVYIFSDLAVMGLVPLKELAHSGAPYAKAAEILFGPIGSVLVVIGAIAATFGALNGWILLQGQIPLAAAHDGLFPKFFTTLSRYGTPLWGLLVSSTLMTCLLLLTLSEHLVKQFTVIILLETLAVLILYFFTTMAELVLFIKKRKAFKGQRLLAASIIAILAGAYAFWAIIGSGKDIVFYGILLFFSSIPVYVCMKWWQLRNLTAN